LAQAARSSKSKTNRRLAFSVAMSERPQHVVFMNFPATGHMNPTLVLVRELRDKKVPVTYFVAEQMREVVEANGAQWRYMQDAKELSEEQLAKYVPPEARPEGTEFPCNLMIHAASAMPAMIEALQALEPPPSVIVYDPFLPLGYVAARYLQIPSVATVTITGPGVLDMPPVVRESWEKNLAVQRASDEIKAEYGIDVFEHAAFLEFYSQDLNVVTTVDSLFCPPKLEMQLQRFGNVPFRCVGPLVNQKVHRISNAEIKEQPMLPWDQIDSSKPLVFLSLGTVANSHFWTNKFGHQAMANGVQDLTGKEFIQLVFRTAYEAFAQEDVFVVMAVGPKEDALEGMPEAPKNFLLQKSVPQLELLPKCQAFVTHGGANSMHEALGFGVPMAVVPIFGDQPSNAEAVAKANCGVSFKEPLKTLSPESLREAVRQLIVPDSAFRASCAKLGEEVAQAGGAAKAAELVLAVGRAQTSKLGGA